MTAAISTRQLEVTFPRRWRVPEVRALRPLNLEVARGRIVGVLGPNGSGKTTLLRVLAGLQPPSAGTVTVLGGTPATKAVQRRVGFQPEGALPIGVLSASEYLAWVGAELGLDNSESDRRAGAWLERLELKHAGRRWLRTFSTGMQKRVALAAALLGEPDLLLLDEPTAGLDPFGSRLVAEILRERAAAAGTTVLMASHHLLEVEEICDEALVLAGGTLRARGTLDELLAGDDEALVVRGLDAAAREQLVADLRGRGGEVRVERRRSHLFALFRRLAERPGTDGG